MLDQIPTTEEMVALIGQPLHVIWDKLCITIEEKYDMERIWDRGGQGDLLRKRPENL